MGGSLFPIRYSTFAIRNSFAPSREAERRKAHSTNGRTLSEHGSVLFRGALAFRRFARGTRQRLLPRCSTPDPCFLGLGRAHDPKLETDFRKNHAPAKTAERVFCPPSPVPVQRAPRGPVVMVPQSRPGTVCETARGHTALAPQSGSHPECALDERDLPLVTEMGTNVKERVAYSAAAESPVTPRWSCVRP